MKFRILSFMLVLIALFASACAVVVSHYMTVIPLSVDGCTITVSVLKEQLIDYETADVFVSDPFFLNGLNMQTLYDVGQDDELTVNFSDSLGFDGTFNVAQYVYTGGKWYFQILGDGERTVVFIQSLFAGVSNMNVKDITDAGWIWVDGDYVEEFEEPILRCDETNEHINVDEPDGESVSRLYMCRVGLTEADVPGRVGPGANRAIRAYIPHNRDGYGVSAQDTDDEGNLWYELDVPNLGLLWVRASQTSDEDFAFINNPITDDTILNDCTGDAIPHKSVPIIVSQQLDNPNAENSDCEGFGLVSPLGSVPTGEATFKWSAAPGADEYSVMFYDYTGSFAAQYAVTSTSLTINTGNLPTGSQLSWEVYALRDSEIFCRSPRSNTLTRLAHEIIITETEEPTPEPKKKKKKGSGGYTPPVG